MLGRILFPVGGGVVFLFLPVGPVLVLALLRRVDDAGNVAGAAKHETHRAAIKFGCLKDRLGRRYMVLNSGLQINRNVNFREVNGAAN